MSGTAPTAQRLVKLTPAHLVRVGGGLDAVRVQARGFGLLFGSFGLRWVPGAIDAVVFRRFGSGRCRALFIGLRGIGWASIALAPAGLALVPPVEELRPPELPSLSPLPALEVHLAVRAPEPP
jgi:hypothetical protein